jgi:hypothetical protein
MACHPRSATQAKFGQLPSPLAPKWRLFLTLPFLIMYLLLSPARLSAAMLVIRPTELDFAIVEVNGERRFLRSGEQLTVFRGDIIQVKRVALRDQDLNVDSTVLFKWVPEHRGSFVQEMAGKRFDTAKLSVFRSATHEAMDSFSGRIVFRTGNVRHGFIQLNVIAPTLQYVEVSVNQTRHLLRDGAVIKVKPEDLFKVFHVETNLPKSETVYYQVSQDKERYYLQFARKNILFATVTLDMEP